MSPTHRMPYVKQQLQAQLINSNSTLSTKPMSPNSRDGKLNVTLIQNNSLIERSKEKLIELPMSPGRQQIRNNKQQKDCC